MGTVIVLGVAGLAALFYALSMKGERTSARRMLLVNGKRYAIAYNLTAEGTGTDAVRAMFISHGFCNLEKTQPIFDRSGKLVQVQMIGYWCAQNTDWEVPSNVAIGEV